MSNETPYGVCVHHDRDWPNIASREISPASSSRPEQLFPSWCVRITNRGLAGGLPSSPTGVGLLPYSPLAGGGIAHEQIRGPRRSASRFEIFVLPGIPWRDTTTDPRTRWRLSAYARGRGQARHENPGAMAPSWVLPSGTRPFDDHRVPRRSDQLREKYLRACIRGWMTRYRRRSTGCTRGTRTRPSTLDGDGGGWGVGGGDGGGVMF